MGRDEMDLTRADDIVSRMREIRPDIVVNAAGFTAVDDAESAPDTAMLVNAQATAILAEEARRSGALLLHYSTDYVFDGTKSGVYSEEDETNPVNVYGKTKLAGEQNIKASGCRHLILRASWIYGARGTNFVRTMLSLARKHEKLQVVADQIGSPTWAPDLASATARILLSPKLAQETLGIYHLSAEGHTSRHAFAEAIIDMARQASGINAGWAKIEPTTTADYPRPAQRPLNAATSKAKIREKLGITMRDWKIQLRDCLFSLAPGELM